MTKSRCPLPTGFTLVELIVVIGIIVILAGILLVVAGGLGASAAIQSTKTTLATAQAMLNEYERIAGPLPATVVTINPIQASSADYTAGGTVLPAGLLQTQAVMAKLLAIPANKAILQKLPPDLILKDANGILLLDAWKTPIVFAPSGGMQWMYYNGGLRTNFGSPSGRPFFASAGPDKRISVYGDDNLYSFDN